MFKKLFQSLDTPHWLVDLFLAIPRIFTGYLMTTSFGASKFGMPWSPEDKNLGLFEVAYWFPSDVAQFGGIFAQFPEFFSWMGGFSEAVGGVLLILGLHTRLAAFLILCTMLVAAFCQQWHNELWQMLPALGFAWVALYVFFLGSGRIGIDHFISKYYFKN